MKLRLLVSIGTIVFIACGTPKQTSTSAPPVQRIPAKFDFSPPSRAQVASTGITIAIVRPLFVGKNPEYYVAPFNEMAESMGNDFQELLTAKGFTVRGPFGSRDEMVYNDKLNSSFVLEVGIDINPQYNRKYSVSSKTNWGSLFDKSQPAAKNYYYMNGEVTLAGNLVINVKSSQYGELIWKKSIALEPASFTYKGTATWSDLPTMKDELQQDNHVYNTISQELEKFYNRAINLAWTQIDPAEMKTVADQAKKADKRS